MHLFAFFIYTRATPVAWNDAATTSLELHMLSVSRYICVPIHQDIQAYSTSVVKPAFQDVIKGIHHIGG
jgi:hypothetical protein